MTGIVVAGGKNKRMGRNKSFLRIGNRTFIEIILDKLYQICDVVIIVTNSIKEYQDYNAKIVKDIVPDKGPIGGLYTGLKYSNDKYNLAVACDMPFINIELLEYMKSCCREKDVVIPRLNSGYEAMCAVYSRCCAGIIEKHMREDKLRLTDILPLVRVREIDEETVKQYDPRLLSFSNINTDVDYRRILAL